MLRLLSLFLSSLEPQSLKCAPHIQGYFCFCLPFLGKPFWKHQISSRDVFPWRSSPSQVGSENEQSTNTNFQLNSGICFPYPFKTSLPLGDAPHLLSPWWPLACSASARSVAPESTHKGVSALVYLPFCSWLILLNMMPTIHLHSHGWGLLPSGS